MTKNVTNLAASVRQHLANLARQRNEEFGLLLTKICPGTPSLPHQPVGYQKIFVLKGALLFELWTEQAHRPTRTLIFSPMATTTRVVLKHLQEICALTVDEDGLQFDPESVKAQRIQGRCGL